jgi:glycosyltransferase involved in cell wall biosynthesis
MSGSDIGYHRVAQEAQKLGHDVTLFTFPKDGTTLPETWEGLKLRHVERRGDEEFNAFVCWNESDPLHAVRAKLRCVSLQINTIVQRPGDSVDLWLSPSQSHKDRLQNHHPAPFEVVPDGCDLEPFDMLFANGFQKVPGRVVWTSSPDRGLHWLLQEWPMIKRAVPHANLRVFYKLKPWLDHFRERPALMEDSIQEQHRRALYIEAAMPRLANMGVEFFDSVSRVKITQEVAAAEVFAYPADTVIWSEGFSVSTAEACAARACPIITNVDAFPEIYGGTLPMVDLPLSKNAPKFRELVIRALTDMDFRNGVNQKARALAERFTWKKAAERMCQVLEEHLARKA